LQGLPAIATAGQDHAQVLAPLVFEHLVPAEKGFPSPITMAGAQDGDGFIWFGTQSGLGRWDGYRMRNFVFSVDDSRSLPGDNIQTVHVDRQGRLWVGTTTDGLAMYDKQTESFIRFPAGKLGVSSPAISAIASDEQGGIWVGSAAGLDYIDTRNGNAIRHFKREGGAPGSNQIRALLVDKQGDLWIGSSSGLAHRESVSGRIQDVVINGGISDAVLALASNARGEVVFGTFRSGIGQASTERGVASARILPLDQVDGVGTAMVLSITETVPGQWWAATYGGGIIEFDSNGHGRRILHRPAMPTSLAHDRVASLWRDRSGLVWVANERGIDVYNPANRTFDTVLDGVGLQEISASAFMTDSGGRLWVALGDQGIDLIGPDGIRAAGLRPDLQKPETALPNRMILAMAEAEPQEAWIGTLLGLYHTSEHGSRVQRVPLPQADALPRIGSIVRQGQVLWLGTQSGLLRFDSKAGTIQAIGAGPGTDGTLSDSRITTMLADTDGSLWIGTRNGLNRFDPHSGKIEQILPAPERSTALPQGLINSLAFDAQGRLWVGTNSGGIGVLDGRLADGTRRFLRVDRPAGVPFPAVNGMVADQAGYMWASTNHGIAVIDANTLRMQMLERGDGVLFQAYYSAAAGKTAQSDIVFGTSGGYVLVHPQLRQQWRYQPPLAVSSVHLDRQAVPAGPLLAPGGAALSIPAGTHNVEIEVAALDFSASQRNRYAFRLDGYDKDWVEVDANRRLATYANVPPGRYRLHMRGSNRDGIWSPHELEMELHFLPAWYQTWWARLSAGLAVLVLGWGAYRWRVRQLRFTQLVLQQQVYSRTQHLERVNSIVKSINEELDFDALLRAILRESGVIGSLRASYALICEAGGEQLSVRASWQQTAQALGQGISRAEAEASLVHGADCIAQDIFVSRQGRTLTVRICAEQRLHGYLVFEQDAAFTDSDVELFEALKEPFVSAFQKADAISAIQQARTAAEASARAKSDFLANISHEIRTPMNAILGFADLGKHLDLPTKPRDYFSKIRRAGQNLLGIIDDVLDFSKIESGKLQLESVPLALSDVLSQIADLFSWRVAEKGLELLVWAAPDVPRHLIGDPLRLSQVLVNLVGNALKFTTHGHVVLHVELAEAQPLSGGPVHLRFSVEDSGVGINADQQSRLFHAFSQADSSTTRLYGGTGLGLAISQQLVQAMGGMIEVESEPGEGSRFSFNVLFDVQADQSTLRTPVPGVVLAKKILVVDDCAPARDMLVSLLSSHGFAVSAVSSGTAALAALQAAPTDLVLLDWDMPELDGIEVARRIYCDPAYLDLPVVLMVTEFAREQITQACEEAGIHASLAKPVDEEQLLDIVLSALGFDVPRLSVPVLGSDGLSEAASHISGARVLVVDDNVINQQVAREVLLRAGVHVELAGSGDDAIHLVEHNEFDAVLMDIQMPGMDGYEATARIRTQERHVRLPVIAMTAHAVAGFRESSMAMGMNDYVTKPIEAERLYTVLAHWIKLDPDRAVMATPVLAKPVVGFSLSGVKVDEVLERLGGNKQLLLTLLEKFVSEFEPTPQRLVAAIEQGAFESAALLMHKIRGAAANLSMPELHRTAGELELLLLSSQLGKCEEALAAFGVELDSVIDGIRAWESDLTQRPEAVSS